MKLFFKNLTQGLSIWLGIVIILGMTYFALRARQTTNPWLTDSSPTALYVNNWETLTAAKWNTLVDKKWLKDLTIINCYSSSSSRWGGGRKDITWTTSLCGGDLPSNYSKCYYAAQISVWDNWSFYCNLANGRTYSTTAYNSIKCSYLCRNE